jgi:hypothetical protein
VRLRVPLMWAPAWFSAVFLAAVAARIVLALVTKTNGDIESFRWVAHELLNHPLDVYVDSQPGSGRLWNNPGGFFPLLVIAEEVHRLTGLSFEVVIRLIATVANVALVFMVDAWLRSRDAPTGERLIAATILLLSPLLILEAGYHGQVDMTATLLATGAVVAWGTVPAPKRPWVAGLLIGAALSVKLPVGVIAIALVLGARSNRERVILVGSAGLVALAAIGPWLLRDPHAFLSKFKYEGLPDAAGWNVLIQPRLAENLYSGSHVAFSGLQGHLQAHTWLLTVPSLAAVTALLVWRRPPVEIGACLLLLAGYASGVNLAPHYVLWIIPMLLLARWWKAAAVLQVALTVPVVFAFRALIDDTLGTPQAPWSPSLTRFVYVPVVDVLFLGAIAALVLLALRLVRTGTVASRARA